jgi:type I restriction enzyme S subunit
MAEPTAKLGELAVFVGSGVTPRGGDASYVSEGVLFIRSQNVHFGGLRLDDAAFITEETHRAMSRSAVLPEDVLLNITGASIGRVAMAPRGLPAANVNQHVCIIRVRRERIDPGYLAAFLASHDGQRQIWSLQAGLSRQALNYEQAKAIEIPVPPLDEQRRIAAVLSAMDNAATAQGRVATSLARLRALVVEERLARLETSVPLGDVLEGIDAGWSPQCEQSAAAPGEWGVLKVSAVSWGRFQPSENKALPRSLAPRPEITVRAGDVLVSRANTPELVGRSVVVRGDHPTLMLSDKLLRLRPCASRVDGRFVNAALSWRAVREMVMAAATGSSRSMKNISQGALRAVRIPLPPLAEQQRLADVLDAIEREELAESVLVELHAEAKRATARQLLGAE